MFLFISIRLWHRCFPVNFAKFLKTPFCRTPPGAASVERSVKMLPLLKVYIIVVRFQNRKLSEGLCVNTFLV